MLSMNYFLLCAVFVLIFAYVVYSYMQQDASKAQALKEKVIVIDCRNQNEWDRGHVNVGNVLHIPLPQLENSPKLAKIKKELHHSSSIKRKHSAAGEYGKNR